MGPVSVDRHLVVRPASTMAIRTAVLEAMLAGGSFRIMTAEGDWLDCLPRSIGDIRRANGSNETKIYGDVPAVISCERVARFVLLLEHTDGDATVSVLTAEEVPD